MRIDREIRRFGRRAASAFGIHLARTSRYQLVPRDYHSPIPDFDELPEDIWDRRTALRGIHFSTDEQIAWAERELAPHVSEFDAPESGKPEERRSTSRTCSTATGTQRSHMP